jgi:cation diffusion facilitator CzcD-associated flavoprotein CzcO
VQLNTKIVESVWDDTAGKWNIKLERNGQQFEDQADILLNATGFLNKWKWPDIPGLHSFNGQLVHSANWDVSLDWKDKRVAIIGNGSSAIQILPEAQKECKSVTTYVRAKAWITANMCAEFTPDKKSNFQFTEKQKAEFRENPGKLKEYRKQIEATFNSYFFAFIRDSMFQKGFRAACETSMKEELNHDERLCSELIPEWDVGCRRITPGIDYLKSLQAENVKVNFDGIEEITPSGIKSKTGEEEEFDVIVCATGFDTSFKPFWNLIGRNGVDLRKQWEARPYAYCGVAAVDIPNYWIFTGPNSPLGHGSLFSVIDAVAEYIMRWIEKISTNEIK